VPRNFATGKKAEEGKEKCEGEREVVDVLYSQAETQERNVGSTSGTETQ
jgi:hypothetical protein